MSQHGHRLSDEREERTATLLVNCIDQQQIGHAGFELIQVELWLFGVGEVKNEIALIFAQSVIRQYFVVRRVQTEV